MKSNVSIKDYFRPKNEKKLLQDPTNDFSIIPSWRKEFSCLIGLEEVVQFRLQRLDKTVYTAANKHGTRGRQKGFPITEVLPATLPKDPNTCAKCNTDVSCSWQHDMNSNLLCHSCFKCNWRKDRWLSIKPTKTNIKSISDNWSILTACCQPVWNEPQSIKEAVLPLQNSSHLIPQGCDQQVPKNPLSSSSNFHPESPFYSFSPLSSDLSSSPPGYFFDTPSHWPSSLSSGDRFSCVYHSSSSCGSSPSDDSSPMYLPSSSDLNSSTSMTSSPSSSPPSKWVSQKVKTPYWMESPLAKALIQDDKAKKKMKKDEEEQSRTNKSQSKKDKTGKMAALSIPSSSSNQQVLPRLQSAIPYSEPSLPLLLNISKQKVQTQVSTPNPQKNGLVSLEKVNPNVSSGEVSCTTSGSSTYTSDSGKSKSTVRKLPTTWSAVSGNITQQDSRSVPRCFDLNQKESAMKNKKFSTKVPHQMPRTRPSSSLIGSAPTHVSFISKTAQSKPQDKVNWEAAPNPKMDEKIQKPQISTGSHGSYPSHSSSS